MGDRTAIIGRSAPTAMDMPDGQVGVAVGVLLQPRPRLTSIDIGDGAFWMIHRRVENGRYRWSARLSFDGERRSTRQEDWDDWRARQTPPGPPRPPGFPADHRPVA